MKKTKRWDLASTTVREFNQSSTPSTDDPQQQQMVHSPYLFFQAWSQPAGGYFLFCIRSLYYIFFVYIYITYIYIYVYILHIYTSNTYYILICITYQYHINLYIYTHQIYRSFIISDYPWIPHGVIIQLKWIISIEKPISGWWIIIIRLVIYTFQI
jgi:hypothetical protein